MANVAIHKSVSLYTEGGLGYGSKNRPAVPPEVPARILYLGGQSWDYVGSNSPEKEGWRDPNRFRYEDISFTDISNGSITNEFTPNKGIPLWYWKSILHSPSMSVTCYSDDPSDEGYPYLCATGTAPVRRPSSWSTLNRVTHDWSALEASAINYSLSKLRDQPIHMGMFLAGIPQTARMVLDTVRGIDRALRCLKRGDVNGAIHAIAGVSRGVKPKHIVDKLRKYNHNLSGKDLSISEVLSSKWLELQFGWMNLYSDIKGLIELVPKVESMTQMPRVTGRAVRFSRLTSDVYYDESTVNSAYGVKVGINSYVDTDAIVICRIDYNIGSPKLYMASCLGLVNPLEVVWDRIPFSFVFDWFVPVGNFIKSMTADAGLDYLGGSITRTENRCYHISQSPLPMSKYGKTYQPSGGEFSYVITHHSTKRTPLLTSPNFRWSGQFRLPDSMWHLVTSLALMRQRAGSMFNI